MLILLEVSVKIRERKRYRVREVCEMMRGTLRPTTFYIRKDSKNSSAYEIIFWNFPKTFTF